MNDGFKKFDLTGKTALITGGGTGLGYEMTKGLLQSGAKVMIAARRENVLKDAAEKLNKELSVNTVLHHTVDLFDKGSVQALVKHAQATMGGVDIFIGNAGVEFLQPIDKLEDSAIDQQIRANLTANIELTRALLPGMRKKKWGRFIYSSSIASEVGSAADMFSVYGAAKSALNAFARSVAAEGGPDGITANSLVLGAFKTDMLVAHLNTLSEEARQQIEQALSCMTFVRRMGEPKELAGLVQLLASDAGSYLTGVCLHIDGGITAAFRPG